jgi:hypothetical protein
MVSMFGARRAEFGFIAGGFGEVDGAEPYAEEHGE